MPLCKRPAWGHSKQRLAEQVGGDFAFHFTGARCWQSRLLEQLIGLRNRIGVPYGDQELFVEASVYRACG